MRFGLSLIEIAAYRLPDGRTLLQPRVLAKTEILQRTLVLGPQGPLTFQEAAQAEDSSTTANTQREWFTSFWKDVLARMKLDDPAVLAAEPARSTNQFFPMPPSGAMAWISAYVAQSSKKGGVYLTFAKAFERAGAVYELLESDREAIEREVGVALRWERTADRFSISVPNVSFDSLENDADRMRVTEYLADMASRLIRTFRPRLQAASRESTGK